MLLNNTQTLGTLHLLLKQTIHVRTLHIVFVVVETLPGSFYDRLDVNISQQPRVLIIKLSPCPPPQIVWGQNRVSRHPCLTRPARLFGALGFGSRKEAIYYIKLLCRKSGFEYSNPFWGGLTVLQGIPFITGFGLRNVFNSQTYFLAVEDGLTVL